MAGKPRYTVEQVVAALEACNGLLYMAAEKLGCSGQTVLNYMSRHPSIRQLVLERRGKRVDIGEAMLDRAVLAGEGWAIRFLLSTQGRDRGYLPAVQLEGGARPLEVRLIRDPDFYGTRDRLQQLTDNGEAP
jgi:hypothetical protein